MPGSLEPLYVGSEQVYPLLREVGLGSIIPQVDEVLLFLRFEMSRLGIDVPDGLCVAATRMLKNSLLRSEHVPAIVEGEVVLGPGDYMEHRISLFRLEKAWVVLDLTAAQFERFAGADVVALVADPSDRAVLECLRTELRWS